MCLTSRLYSLAGLLLSAAGLAACQQSPLQAVGAIEDASTAALLISGTDTIAKYLDDPSVVCTGFLPTNEVGSNKRFTGRAQQQQQQQQQQQRLPHSYSTWSCRCLSRTTRGPHSQYSNSYLSPQLLALLYAPSPIIKHLTPPTSTPSSAHSTTPSATPGLDQGLRDAGQLCRPTGQQ
jgi:hypothetical protein